MLSPKYLVCIVKNYMPDIVYNDMMYIPGLLIQKGWHGWYLIRYPDLKIINY